MQHPVFSRNLFYPGTALLCSIPSFSEIYSIQELLSSAASRLFQESIPSRNCSALQHPVFSWNLFYQGTVLLCSILSLPGIYSIQEPLCSAAFLLFQESFYPGTDLLCSILSFPGSILSKNCTDLQHSLFFRNLFYLGAAVLCSIPSFPGVFLSKNCSALQHSPLFHKSRLYRNCSALHHSVFSRNLFNPGTAPLSIIPSFQGIYSIQKLLCSMQHPVNSRNIFHLGTALLCSIPSFPGIYPI